MTIKTLCPRFDLVLKAFTECSRHDCKVIMLGQDPYPQRGVATGIAFANHAGTKVLSPSLQVIKDSVERYCGGHMDDCTLEHWEKQGVLMLNSSLTCEEGRPGSHVLLWSGFMKCFLEAMSEWETGIVYVLLGKQAQLFEPCINSRFNYIIKEKHPSWYHRCNKEMPYDVFRNTDEILKGLYGKGINWCSNC